MSIPTDLPVQYGKRSQFSVGVRASQQSLEAAPVPGGYQTVVSLACSELTSYDVMVTTKV